MIDMVDRENIGKKNIKEQGGKQTCIKDQRQQCILYVH